MEATSRLTVRVVVYSSYGWHKHMPRVSSALNERLFSPSNHDLVIPAPMTLPATLRPLNGNPGRAPGVRTDPDGMNWCAEPCWHLTTPIARPLREAEMSDRRTALSPIASLLLHRHEPGEPGYHSWALGLLGSPDGLEPIDAAYTELVDRGLLEAAGLPVPVLPGVLRDAFVLAPPARSELPADAEGPSPDILPRDCPGEPSSVDLPVFDSLSASVDLPTVLPAESGPGPARAWSFRQSVRVGIGVGIGFWLVGLAGLASAFLVLSLLGWSPPAASPTGPATGATAVAAGPGNPP